jgi:hypothetical protein
MHYEVGYITFEGAAGSTRVPQADLPFWLDRRPGTVIRSITIIGSMDECSTQRNIRLQASKDFAEGILRNLP